MNQRTPVRKMMPLVRPEPDVACRGLLSTRILKKGCIGQYEADGPRVVPYASVVEKVSRQRISKSLAIAVGIIPVTPVLLVHGVGLHSGLHLQ